MSNLLSIVLVFDVNLKSGLIKEDPDDNKFIECALQLGIKIIVSGDIHLLNFKKYKFINIYNPTEFYNAFKKKL